MPNGASPSDHFFHPRDEADLRALITRARREGRSVRVRGAAHSVHAAIFTDGYAGHDPDPDGIDIMLDHFRAVEYDEAAMRVTVEAGCHLGRDPADPSHTSTLDNSLFYQLDRRGWAFPDTGGIIHQTVAGFLGTGSSGGSLQHSVGDQIVAIRLMDGRGEIHTLTMEGDEHRFLAAGVSVGLLGIVLAVTFQCVPTFTIIGQESTTSEDDCPIDLFGPGSGKRPSLERFFRETEHSRLLWWPQQGVRRVVVWQGRRLTAPEAADPAYARPRPYEEFPVLFGSTLPAQLLGGGFFYAIRLWNTRGLLGRLTRALLDLILAPFLKIFVRLDGKKGPQRFWDVWWRTLPMDNGASDTLLPTQFTEMWIPVSRSAEVMAKLRDHFRSGGFAATGPYACEVYASRPSRFWLSPAYQRDVIKVDMFWYGRNKGDPSQTFYPQFWELLRGFQYRLHWGKYLPDDSASYLRPLYSKWDDFMRVRAELDPDQVFVTAYWRKHLGIPLPCAPAGSRPPESLGTVPVRIWGPIPNGRACLMVELLDRHMVTENAGQIEGIMETLVREPRFVMEYMPFSLGDWSWFTRKRWQGRDAVVAFYRGFFKHFRSLRISALRYTVSAKGLVNAYRLQARVLGIPVSLSMAAVFDWDEREGRFVGERVYFRERSALEQIRPAFARTR
jgi:FAD/FMN-containing dehydrogenase